MIDFVGEENCVTESVLEVVVDAGVVLILSAALAEQFFAEVKVAVAVKLDADG